MSSSQSGLQSGINVSPALVTAFNEASSSPSTRALKISIKDESLEPNGTLDRKASAEEDFPQLREWFEDTEAGYIIYFLDTPSDSYFFISYVPETSNVRSKMLYASTRSTLISALGLRTQRLEDQIIATSKSDLTFPSKSEAGISLSDLSIREKELAEIKLAEAETMSGTSRRRPMVSSSGVSFPVSDEAKDAITALTTLEGDELIQLCIGEEEIFELAAANSIMKGEEIKDIIFEDEPRFTFFRYVHDYKGEETSSLLFIYSCPSSSSVKQRMVYASSRSAILAIAAELGAKVDVKIETSEVDELTLKFLSKEVHGAEIVEEKRSFARPRGPPRRAQKVVKDDDAGNTGSGTE